MPSPLGEGVRGPDRGRMREKYPAAGPEGEAFRKETYALPHLK